MNTKIEILILGVERTKDGKKSVLDYDVVDLKESSNRKGFNVGQAWFDNDEIFNQIKSSDIGTVLEADISFEIGSNSRPRMLIENVYN